MTQYICFRILDNNFIDLDILPNSSATSTDASFPLTNAFNLQRRSKLWRSAGYFEVTTSNNVYKFDEGASTLSATITAGTYTSKAAFITALQSAINVVASDNHAVTQVNGKFTLASDGSTYNILASDAGFTCNDLIGMDTTDRTGATSYICDEIRAHYPSERITFDMGVATNPSVFCMTGKRNQGLQISSNATIKLEGNTTDNWTSAQYSQTLTYDDEVISLFSDSGLHTAPLRYWSIEIDDPTNPNLYVEIGAFFLGEYFNPQRGRPQFPFSETFVDRSETVFAEGGETYSDAKEQTKEYSVDWLGLQKEDLEEFRNIYEKYGTARPIWAALDTGQVYSTDKKIIFCKFVDDPVSTLVSPDNFELSMRFREEL